VGHLLLDGNRFAPPEVKRLHLGTWLARAPTLDSGCGSAMRVIGHGRYLLMMGGMVGSTRAARRDRESSRRRLDTVASPIFVEGRLWGVVSVSDDKQLPGGRRTPREVHRPRTGRASSSCRRRAASSTPRAHSRRAPAHRSRSARTGIARGSARASAPWELDGDRSDQNRVDSRCQRKVDEFQHRPDTLVVRYAHAEERSRGNVAPFPQ
jgi:hypothetical protein